MEKNKNKKKLFAIIGASALAFVLTIALSVSITLAYFGGANKGATTLKTGGSVEVGSAATATATTTALVPGQKFELSIGTTVKSSSTQTAYLVAFVKVSNDGTEALTGLNDLVTGNIADTWKDTTKTSNGYAIYLYGTATAGTAISLDGTDKTINLVNSTEAVVPTTWDNRYADKTTTVDVVFVAVQPPIGTDGAPVTADATLEQLTTVVNAILAASTDTTVKTLSIPA